MILSGTVNLRASLLKFESPQLGIGMTLSQRGQEKKLQRNPVPTIGEILATAGIIIRDEAVATRTLQLFNLQKILMSQCRQALIFRELSVIESQLVTAYSY